MKIAVSATGTDLGAEVAPVFGRCPYYLFVDTDTMQFEAVQNPTVSAPGGAGIQAAQFVISRGARAVLTGNVGPNAFGVFQAAGVSIYPIAGGTVQEAISAYKEGRLQALGGATASPYAGMGMGWGGRRGMGGRWSAGTEGGMTPPAPLTSSPTSLRQEELSALREMASDLQKRLDEVMERLKKLEGESKQ
ncbi:MAG: DUF5320 family protein [Chloroflexi bacterium]|nr:DUF5320 family protein [Chloroflexota bacterium]